jgi:hypothetical protein
VQPAPAGQAGQDEDRREAALRLIEALADLTGSD